MSLTRKVIATDADLATIQRTGNHQVPLFWVYLCWNADNNAVEKEKKKSKQLSNAEAVSSLIKWRKQMEKIN